MPSRCPPEPPADPRQCPMLTVAPEGETPDERHKRMRELIGWITFDYERAERRRKDPLKGKNPKLPSSLPCTCSRNGAAKELLRSDGKWYGSISDAARDLRVSHNVIICAMKAGRVVSSRGNDRPIYRFHCLACLYRNARRIERKWATQTATKQARPLRAKEAA